jgi:hypothetical protein
LRGLISMRDISNTPVRREQMPFTGSDHAPTGRDI